MNQLVTVFFVAALLAAGIVLVALGDSAQGAVCITAAVALTVPSDITGAKARLGGKK